MKKIGFVEAVCVVLWAWIVVSVLAAVGIAIDIYRNGTPSWRAELAYAAGREAGYESGYKAGLDHGTAVAYYVGRADGYAAAPVEYPEGNEDLPHDDE